MTIKRPKYKAGITLVEEMAAILILSVAVIGASGYRYHSALDARKADQRAAATRIALLLCENWRGISGDETFDPENYWGHDLPLIEDSAEGPEVPIGFTTLQTSTVEINNVFYYVTMSWQDVAAGLRALNVAVAWNQNDSNSGSTAFADADKTFKLTTYVATN
ncbi:MAG: type IV pilus modification PilV family protein [Planctomycetota bacterium]